MTESEQTLYNELSSNGKDLYDFYSIKHKDWSPTQIVKKIICKEELLEKPESLDFVLSTIVHQKEQEEYNNLSIDDKKLYDLVTIKHPNWNHSQKMTYTALDKFMNLKLLKNLPDIVV